MASASDKHLESPRHQNETLCLKTRPHGEVDVPIGVAEPSKKAVRYVLWLTANEFRDILPQVKNLCAWAPRAPNTEAGCETQSGKSTKDREENMSFDRRN